MTLLTLKSSSLKNEFRGWVGDFFLTCLHWWMMLTHEMVCKDAASFGVTAETAEKRQHAQFPPWIPTLFSPALLPLSLGEQLCTPQTKVHRQKRNIKTQRLFMQCCQVALIFFPSVYLTDNMKSLLHVMSRWALGITLALPILLISLAKMCLGQGIVERPWVWVTHLYKVSAFMQRHIARLLKVSPKTEWLLCPTLRSTELNVTLVIPDHMAVWRTLFESQACLISRTAFWWIRGLDEGKSCWFVSGPLWRISSCVIRPKSDPTCPDVPPRPSSCPRRPHADERLVACSLWPAVWFSEDIPQLPPLYEWPRSTTHYSVASTFVRALFRLPLI